MRQEKLALAENMLQVLGIKQEKMLENQERFLREVEDVLSQRQFTEATFARRW